MTIAPAPTTSNILAAMRSFLTAVLPSDVVVVAGQPNRVPEPKDSRFVVMWPPRYQRVETNVDSSIDSRFTASIAGTSMGVSAFDAVHDGPIKVGSVIFGNGLATPTTVTRFDTGTGGTGSYIVSPAQSVGPRTMSAGSKLIRMNSTAMIQLDFHAADNTSGDLANIVSALLRDEFGVDQFANQSPKYDVAPLYADDARQMPFYDGEQQTEFRWVVDALLQANVVVSVPQQFADAIDLGVISVEATYAQ